MFDSQKKCWICGDLATDREHRNKKTDVEYWFGKGSYKEIKVVKREFGEQVSKPIQGSKSDELKYGKNLCAYCNQTRTQPYDRAYEKFMRYVNSNFQLLMKEQVLFTHKIFNKDIKKEQENLFRFFIKSFGCRIDNQGHAVPIELINAMHGNSYGKSLKVSFGLNIREPCVGEFSLEGQVDHNKKPVNYFWAQFVGGLSIYYVYNREMPVELGEVWYGKSKRINFALNTDILQEIEK